MKKYVAIKDLDLSGATVIGFNDCSVELHGADLVCIDCFGRAVVKFPIELDLRYRITCGLPNGVGIDEDGSFEVFDIDYDDEDYFGDDEQTSEILEMYSYITTMNLTIILKV